MKVKDLILRLNRYDPEMEVMIQQGLDEYDYTKAHKVSVVEVIDMTSSNEDDEEITVIAIEYQ